MWSRSVRKLVKRDGKEIGTIARDDALAFAANTSGTLRRARQAIRASEVAAIVGLAAAHETSSIALSLHSCTYSLLASNAPLSYSIAATTRIAFESHSIHTSHLPQHGETPRRSTLLIPPRSMADIHADDHIDSPCPVRRKQESRHPPVHSRP
jgi:hypothetical protein